MITVEQERDKYRRMWGHPLYRQCSPAVRGANVFLTYCLWHRDDTAIDLGCGTGRGASILSCAGLNVTMLDLVDVVDVGLSLPFIQGNLWELNVPAFDWIFCCDVLEHIPPEHIEKTLDGMQRITRKGGYLQIALQPDGCGSLIGEKLHLTLEDQGWWKEQVCRRWNNVKNLSTPGAYANFTIGSPK